VTTFTIPGRLPGLNDYVAACRSNPHAGAKMKRDADALVRSCLAGAKPVPSPVHVSIRWIEKNARRDPDNVRFGIKFILDALVGAGVLTNDTQRDVASMTDTFEVDKVNPRVEVEVST
jgi:Holliday junction resolvase RusA-like endonuclease